MIRNYKIIGWDVDTQRGFMETKETTGYQGQLALLDNEFKPKGAMEIAPNLKKVTEYLRANDIPIMGSVDWHNKDSKEFDDVNPDFVSKFPTHCVRDTYDAQNIDATTKINPFYVDWDKDYSVAELIERIRNYDGEVVFRKDNFNVFEESPEPEEGIGNPYARSIVKALGVEKVVMYGVATDVCDNFAVNGFKNMGIEVYAIEDAMQGVTPNNHRDAIARWRLEGVNVVRLEDIVSGRVSLR